MNPLTRAARQVWDMKMRIFLGLVAASLVGAVTTANAKVVQMLIDKVLASGQGHYLAYCIELIIAIQVVKGVLLFISRYYLSQVGHVASKRVRNQIFGKLEALSLSFYRRHRSGQLLSRMTSDVIVLQNLLTALTSAIIDVFQVLFGVALMFWIQWRLALLTTVTLPLLSLVVRKFSGRVRQIGALMQTRIGDIAAVTQETIAGIKEIQSFGMEERELARFSAVNEDNYRIHMKGAKYQALTQPVVELCHALGMILVVWYGSRSVLSHEITTGDLMEFLTCLGMIFHPIKVLTDVNTFVRQSLAAADRIFELLDEPVDIRSRPGATALDRIEGNVSLDGVSFWYEDAANPVIKGLSLDARPGQVVAFVGPSGAGKTTAVSLLPRFFDVSEGRVTIDGHDVRDVELSSLRRHFGIVPQETVLFSGSVEENIAFGRPEATAEEVRQAARDANAHDFIQALPEGYATLIGERGVKLSGGERQRVAIARAILKDPRILILDEATSSLDSQSERLVQEALDRLMCGRTTFVIAHRLSTVRSADKIVVLDGGEIRETGTHHELLRLGGLYSRLCEAQFKAA